MKKQEQISGAILGAAIGDALGFIIEKKTQNEAHIFVSELKNNELTTYTHRTFPSEYKFGQYSDDTQFSILLIKSLIEHKSFKKEDYLAKLLHAYSNKNLIGLGSNTRKIFNAYIIKDEVEELIKISSNGSVMRSWAIGLFYKDAKDIWKHSKDQSALTHNSEEAILACSVMALMISASLNNPTMTKEYFLGQVKPHINTDFLLLKPNEFYSYIRDEHYHPDWDLIPPGAMVTLKAVLYSVYNNFASFSDALLFSLSLGGDTDSVASLVGALMGTRLGINSIPSNWINIPVDKNFGSSLDLLKLSYEFMESLACSENQS
jgi:ADP-ribosylglycohydrolase